MTTITAWLVTKDKIVITTSKILSLQNAKYVPYKYIIDRDYDRF